LRNRQVFETVRQIGRQSIDRVILEIGFYICNLHNIIEKHFNVSIVPVRSRGEEPDGPAVSALRRAIVEVKQRWSVIGWVTKNVLSRAPPCFGKHVKVLAPVAFAVVSTHQPALGLRGGLWHVLFMCNP
jgi:hypothetical protein